MTAPTIGFIGAGNMATSLIGGMLQGRFQAQQVHASDRNPAQLEQLRNQFGITINTDNAALARECDVLVLAVKPQVMQAVCRELPRDRKPGQLIVSIAAGISSDSLASWLGADAALVRCMPNTPSLRGKGVSGLYAVSTVTDAQRELAERIMNAVGMSLWLDDESQMDAVTAVSGSGPAYFFYMMEAMVNAGEQLGLPRATAERLTLLTALGAADMAVNSDVDCAELRQRVCSPNGTTEKAINSLAGDDFPGMVNRAIQAAAARSAELSRELS